MRAISCFLLGVCLVSVAACSRQSSLLPASPAASSLVPEVRQKGGGSHWVDFLPATSSTASYTYGALVVGPDHNVWFQDMLGNGIVRMTQTGAIAEFTVPMTEDSSAGGMAVGSDNKFYLGAYDPNTSIGYVDVVDTSGNAVSHEIGTSMFDTDNLSGGVALGPDHNIWFVEYSHIGTIAPNGTITQYAYPSNSYYANPGDIVRGSDGNMWFTTGGAGVNPAYLGKIAPSNGAMTFYNLTALTGCAFDNALTEGGDGNVWVDCGTSIVRVTTAGIATAFATPGNGSAGEISGDLTPGASQTIWYGGAQDSNNVVQYDIAANSFHVFVPPATTIGSPRTIITGPDRNLWFTGVKPNSGGRMEIGTYIPNPMTVTPTHLTIPAPSDQATLTVTESGTVHWSAQSSNVNVATVAPGTQSDQFVVTGVAVGTCRVTISDPHRNSVSINVTVL